MPAWLSTLVQRFRTTPVLDPVPVPVLDPVPVDAQVPSRKRRRKPKKEGPRGFQAKMYGFNPRDEKPAPRIIPRGLKIEQHVANDARIVDPYEQKALHDDYLAIRCTSKAECDFCTACFFEWSRPISVKKKNLDKHFNKNRHEGGAPETCRLCTARFSSQKLQWHMKHCHPHIAVGI